MRLFTVLPSSFSLSIPDRKKVIMEKFVPYEKLSKKEQKKIDAEKRRDWNGIDPATKVVDKDKKAYKRKLKHPNKDYDE